MLLKYADDERKMFKERANEGNDQAEDNAVARPRSKLEYVDGVERLADMPLPFLIDLPNGSSEAVFIIGSKNASSGMVPILEYCNGRRTVLDKDGGNGIFLNSHDSTMQAKVCKTVESVPEIKNNTAFWQIFVNLEDVRD